MMIIRILLICKIFVVIGSTDNTTLSQQVLLDDVKEKIIAVTTRVVGGEPASIETYPYAVSVQWRLGGKHHCGGSYIMPRFILSAAHCMIKFSGQRWKPENPRYYLIVAGTSNLWYSPTWQIALTDGVLPHPGFHYGTMAHDIGLYRISKPFRLTPYINYAPMPLAHNPDLFLKKNQTCTVVGWGKTSEASNTNSDILQHADIPLISTNMCARYLTHHLHSSQLCAGKEEGGIDACQGDSGGPLMCNNIQTGIVSWGHGCAAPKSPGVYCRVDLYIEWIQQIVLKNNARSSEAFNFSSFGLILCTTMFFYT